MLTSLALIFLVGLAMSAICTQIRLPFILVIRQDRSRPSSLMFSLRIHEKPLPDKRLHTNITKKPPAAAGGFFVMFV